MREVIVIPAAIGVLGAVSVNFKEYMRRIGVNVKLEVSMCNQMVTSEIRE